MSEQSVKDLCEIAYWQRNEFPVTSATLLRIAYEYAKMQRAVEAAKQICDHGLMFHADIFGFTEWLEEFGYLLNE